MADHLPPLARVAKDVKSGESKTNSKAGADVGADAGAGNSQGVADLKLLKFLWHRWVRTAFKAKSDFILAVQLRHVKLSRKEGEAPVATLSTTNASMAGRDAHAQTAPAGDLYKAEESDDKLDVAKRRLKKSRVQSWGEEGEDSYILSLLEGGDGSDDNKWDL